MQLSALEREFINTCQGGFPLTERPFRQLARQFDCSEDLLIETVRQLSERQILTRFGPLYNAARLGGGLTLAALMVPEERYATVAQMVNSYPEVAHNYRRQHELNMWFVLATRTREEIGQVLQSIENTTRLKVYNFPKQEEFYIGLCLQIGDDNRVFTTAMEHAGTGKTDRLDDTDKKLIHVTQSGLALTATPYRQVAANIDISQNEVIRRLAAMLDNGVIRRIGAVPNHYKLGLRANGMTVWQINPGEIRRLGKTIGQLDFVSHCYQRPPAPPLWPYNLFAMVHGHRREEVEEKAGRIKSILGKDCLAHDILYSSAILKKTGMRLAA